MPRVFLPTPAMAYCAVMSVQGALAEFSLDQATKGLDPPLAVVDLAAFDHNASDLVRRAAGRPIRVASKSVRCRALLDRVLARPGYAGLLCYSLREALWLCAQGTSDDLVVGYPTADRAALASLAADAKARRSITLMADSADQLDLIDEAAGSGHPELRICLDLDASWRPLAWPAGLGGPLCTSGPAGRRCTLRTRRSRSPARCWPGPASPWPARCRTRPRSPVWATRRPGGRCGPRRCA